MILYHHCLQKKRPFLEQMCDTMVTHLLIHYKTYPSMNYLGKYTVVRDDISISGGLWDGPHLFEFKEDADFCGTARSFRPIEMNVNIYLNII